MNEMNEMGMPHEYAQVPAELNKEAINALYAEIANLRNAMNDMENNYDIQLVMTEIAEREMEISALCTGTQVTKEEKLAFAKTRARIMLMKHDSSVDVNSFMLQGKQAWLPKETRVGLANSINIEKAAKKSTTTLWYDGVRYILPIEQALQMLAALELYALECYNVTHSHLANINKLTTAEEVIVYDFKAGYPAKLSL